jgi:hypothetical protein
MRVVLDLRFFVFDPNISRHSRLSLVLGRWVHLYQTTSDFSLLVGPWMFSAGSAVRETEGSYFIRERASVDARADYQALASSAST